MLAGHGRDKKSTEDGSKEKVGQENLLPALPWKYKTVKVLLELPPCGHEPPG